jgi:hypothetical protein
MKGISNLKACKPKGRGRRKSRISVACLSWIVSRTKKTLMGSIMKSIKEPALGDLRNSKFNR